MTKTPKDVNKYSEDELLELLVLGKEAFKEKVKKSKLISRQKTGELWIEYEKRIDQAHTQIVALIKKPEVHQTTSYTIIPGEWIEEKARDISHAFNSIHRVGMEKAKDFIRSLVEEING